MVHSLPKSVSGLKKDTIVLGSEFRVSKTLGKIILDSSDNSIIIKANDIIYAEVLGKTMEIHTAQNLCYTMQFNPPDYNQLIDSSLYEQVDEYLLININRIQKFQVDGIPYIELDTGTRIRTNPMYHKIILRAIDNLEYKEFTEDKN